MASARRDAFTAVRCVLVALLVIGTGHARGEEAADSRAEGGRGDLESQLSELEPRAEAGDAAAQMAIYERQLMSFLRSGGDGDDRASAIAWLERAADQDHPPAVAALAGHYLAGELGLDVDRERGLDLMRRAADVLGDASALRAMGGFHLEGRYGLRRDSDRARTYLVRAARAGSARAFLDLGTLYRAPDRPRSDLAVSYMWYAALREFLFARNDRVRSPEEVERDLVLLEEANEAMAHLDFVLSFGQTEDARSRSRQCVASGLEACD